MNVEKEQFLLGASFCSFEENGCAKQVVEVDSLLTQSEELLSSISPQECFGILGVPIILCAGLSHILQNNAF